MATNEGDWEMTEQDIRTHVAIIFEEPINEIREALEDLLVNDRRKTAEINLLTREIRAKQEALQRILLFWAPFGGITLREMKETAQKALDWKASDE